MAEIALELRLKAQDLFSGLDPERDQEKERRLEVQSDSKLEEITKYFKEALANRGPQNATIEKIYESISQNKMKYCSKDIEEFLVILGKYQDLNYFQSISGLFLSSLINQSEDKDFILHTGSLSDKIYDLGYKNTKNLMIKGDIKSCLGRRMKEGKIIIEGNCGTYSGQFMTGGSIEITGDADDQLGDTMKGGKIIVRGNSGKIAGNFMENGEIIIFGNSGDELGRKMKGGKIVVKGFVGMNIGNAMIGGEIHLNGNYISQSKDIRGGNIYHKGKLLFQDGQRMDDPEIRWK
jgi:hypothetical protein